MTLRSSVRELVARTTRAQGRGNTYFVSSVTGSSGNAGTSVDFPKATIAQALALCSDNQGDVIYVLQGHVQDIVEASGLTISVDGVSIIGLGNGSERPTLTWKTATTATCLVSGDNVLIENIIVRNDIDSLAIMFSVTGVNATFRRVDHTETASKQTLKFLVTTVAGDGLTVENCKHVQVTAGGTKWIDLVGCDNAVIRNNIFHVSASTFIVGGTTTESLNVTIANNLFVNPADAAAVVLLASSTGMVAFNGGGGGKSAIAGMFALAGAYGVENYSVNTANKSGLLDPVVDA